MVQGLAIGFVLLRVESLAEEGELSPGACAAEGHSDPARACLCRLLPQPRASTLLLAVVRLWTDSWPHSRLQARSKPAYLAVETWVGWVDGRGAKRRTTPVQAASLGGVYSSAKFCPMCKFNL